MRALWVRSRNGGESLERVDPNRRVVITSGSGLITLCVWDGTFTMRGAPAGWNQPPPEAWQQWKHWRERVGPFNDSATLPGGFAYPVFLSDRWWGRIGFDASDQILRPTPNVFAIHDWLQPSWFGRQRTLTVPFWAIALLFGITPAVIAFRATRRLTRARRGLCPVCGYDLRASSERCPECGMAVVAAETG